MESIVNVIWIVVVVSVVMLLFRKLRKSAKQAEDVTEKPENFGRLAGGNIVLTPPFVFTADGNLTVVETSKYVLEGIDEDGHTLFTYEGKKESFEVQLPESGMDADEISKITLHTIDSELSSYEITYATGMKAAAFVEGLS